jgi:predicted cupin superfamily sugar epimerase
MIKQTVCCENDVGVTIYFAINCESGHSLECAWVVRIGAWEVTTRTEITNAWLVVGEMVAPFYCFHNDRLEQLTQEYTLK